MLFVGLSQFLLLSLDLRNGSGGIHLQVLGNERCLRGIAAIGHATLIEWRQFYSRMNRRCGGTTHHDGHTQSLALEQHAQLFHLLQRWCDEATHAHQTRLALPGLLQYGFVGHHHPQVNNLETVTVEHDAHNILSYVVHVAVGSGQHHARPFLFLGPSLCVDKGLQMGHGLLHHLGRLHHLGQEHLTFAKQLADVLHGLHQWLFNHVDGATIFLQSLRDILSQVLAHALAQGIEQSLLNTFGAP